jgi:hypothetical protein
LVVRAEGGWQEQAQAQEELAVFAGGSVLRGEDGDL